MFRKLKELQKRKRYEYINDLSNYEILTVRFVANDKSIYAVIHYNVDKHCEYNQFVYQFREFGNISFDEKYDALFRAMQFRRDCILKYSDNEVYKELIKFTNEFYRNKKLI